MFYLEVSIVTQPGKADAVAGVIKESAPHFEKAGIKFIASWSTVVGNANEIVLLHAYDDMAQIQKSSEFLARDQEYQVLYQRVSSMAVSLTRKLMRANAASPMQ